MGMVGGEGGFCHPTTIVRDDRALVSSLTQQLLSFKIPSSVFHLPVHPPRISFSRFTLLLVRGVISIDGRVAGGWLGRETPTESALSYLLPGTRHCALANLPAQQFGDDVFLLLAPTAVWSFQKANTKGGEGRE